MGIIDEIHVVSASVNLPADNGVSLDSSRNLFGDIQPMSIPSVNLNKPTVCDGMYNRWDENCVSFWYIYNIDTSIK